MDHPSKRSSLDNIRQYNDETFSFHPYNVLLTLLLFGLTVIFLALSFSFVYARIQSKLPPLEIPSLFLFNSILLLGGSFAMIKARQAYRQDQTRPYKTALLITLFLSTTFLIMQFFAWKELVDQNIFMHTDNSSAYLYLISGLHLLHVLFGIPFLAYFIWQANQEMNEPVSVLIYFSDPERRLKLHLLTIYWHFLDALWLYLILFFYLIYWTQ